MSQSSWKQTNSRDKTFTLGLNTSITAKDITTSGKLEVNKIDASVFTGPGVHSGTFGGITDTSGEMLIVTANSIRQHFENNFHKKDNNPNVITGQWNIDNGGDIYPNENVRITSFAPGGTLHFVSDVSFDGSIVASDASFGTIGGLNGGPVNLHDVSFSGTIGSADGVSALEVTTDLSVNGSFRTADASFARVGELSSGSKVVFVSDVSFDGSIVASDASFTGVVEIKSLSGDAVVSQITIATAFHDKVPSSYAVREYVKALDVSAFFVLEEGALRPKLASYDNRIGAHSPNGDSLIFVDDVSFHGSIRATDASFTTIGSSTSNTPIVVADDISFQGSIRATDASFTTIGSSTSNTSIVVADDISFQGSINANNAYFDDVHANAFYVNDIDKSLTSIPIGGIIMFYGSLDGVRPKKNDVIYTNWRICDGTNGTPNLSDKFVRGTTTDSNVGDDGGSDTTTLTSANLPSHTHDVTVTYQWDDKLGSNSNARQGVFDIVDAGAAAGSYTIRTTSYTTTSDGGGSASTVNIDTIPKYIYCYYIMRIS